MANPRPTAVFVPRALALVERSTGALVSRFASPVRVLGERVLGFVDRLAGMRLLGATECATEAAAWPSSRRELPFIFPVPWYESDASLARARLRRSPAPATVSTRAAAAPSRGEPVAGPSAAPDPHAAPSETIARPALPVVAPDEAPSAASSAPSTPAVAPSQAPPPAVGAVPLPSPSMSSARPAASVPSRPEAPASMPSSGSPSLRARVSSEPTAAEEIERLASVESLVAPAGVPAALAPTAFRATSSPNPLARALGHIAWADEQLDRLTASAGAPEAVSTRSPSTGPIGDFRFAGVAPEGELAEARPRAPLAQPLVAPEHAPSADRQHGGPAAPSVAPSTLARGSQPAASGASAATASVVAAGLTGSSAAPSSPAAGARASDASPTTATPLRAFTAPTAMPAPTPASSVPAGRIQLPPSLVDSVAARLGDSRIARFLERLVGTRSERDTRMLPIAAPYERAWAAAVEPPDRRRDAALASARPTLSLVAPDADRSFRAAAVAARASETRPTIAPAERLASSTLRPGGIGVQAEQWAGAIGIQAAGVALDFVDPAQAADMGAAWSSLGRTLVAHSSRAVTAASAAGATAAIDGVAHRLAAVAASGVRDAESSAAARLAGVWSLGRVFPSAARAALAAASRAIREQGEHPAPARPPYPAAAGALAGAGYVAPSLVSASDRIALPDGSRPRGSFTWSRSAGFTPRLGDWTPSVTAAAASGDAAERGVPPGEMPLPALHEPSVDAVSSPAGPRPPLVGGGAPARSAPSSARPPAAGIGGFPAEAVPFLRLVAGGIVERAAPGSERAVAPAGGGGWSPPALTTVQPPVAAAPASEATARMVEALRAQQHATVDDRVTLADLTLVAVASATQQLAASPIGGGAPVANAPATNRPSTSPHAAAEPSPEAERREIEELARQVLDEVHSLVEIARERSGGPWV